MTQTSDISPAYDQSLPTAPARYAGFWIRVVAAIIDGIILFIVNFAVDSVLPVDKVDFSGKMTSDQMSVIMHSMGLNVLINMIVDIAIIAALVTSSWQATVGKRAVGIYIITSAGARLSLLTAVLRELCKIISAMIFMIGYMMVGWTKEKTGLHDLMVDTRVVYGRK